MNSQFDLVKIHCGFLRKFERTYHSFKKQVKFLTIDIQLKTPIPTLSDQDLDEIA